MDELIFKLYLNKLGKERSLKNVFKDMSFKEIFILISFIVLSISIIVCIIVGFYVVKIMRFFWIPLTLLVLLILYLNKKSKTEKAITNQINLNIEDRTIS